MEFFPFEKRFYLTKYFLRQAKRWRQGMTAEDRERVISDFAAAALRAYQAGFEMIELHGANGYLLCQFLSAFTNRRSSGEGDELAQRISFPLSVFNAVKRSLPEKFPIGVRIILREWVPGGIDLGEAVEFAKCLEKSGAAYLSASVGTYNSLFSPIAVKAMSRPAYLKEDMKILRAHVNIPAIASGRIVRPSVADLLIRDKAADLIGLGRPLMVDPKWLQKADGEEKKIKICINCNHCLKQVVLEEGFACARWPEVLQQRSRLEHLLLTRNYNALWVISDIRDIDLYKQSWCLIRPEKQQPCPTIVTLKPSEHALEPGDAADDFVKWINRREEPSCFDDVSRHQPLWKGKTGWEEVLADKIASESYGRIFMALNPYRPWKERLIYRERGKIFALLGKNKNPRNIVAAVDFSPATLLLMRFLNQTLMQKENFEFTFVHVKTKLLARPDRQWEKFKKIAGLDETVPLTTIQPASDIPSALMDIVRQLDCGTVVMGKRGISGIKRRLLGSVSLRVLRELTDQNLFLID